LLETVAATTVPIYPMGAAIQIHSPALVYQFCERQNARNNSGWRALKIEQSTLWTFNYPAWKGKEMLATPLDLDNQQVPVVWNQPQFWIVIMIPPPG